MNTLRPKRNLPPIRDKFNRACDTIIDCISDAEHKIKESLNGIYYTGEQLYLHNEYGSICGFEYYIEFYGKIHAYNCETNSDIYFDVKYLLMSKDEFTADIQKYIDENVKSKPKEVFPDENRWYDVKEKRPEIGERVLCCQIENRRIMVGRHTDILGEGNNASYIFKDENDEYICVTHWMPLPEKP